MEEKFLSPQEVADMLQLKKTTVYEMIKRGELRATKMGKQFRIAHRDLMDYMGVPAAGDTPDKIIICGQDVLLDSLCALFNNDEGTKMTAFRSPMGSYRGLYEMYHNDNCVATCHLWDSETDTYNLPYVTRMLPGERLAVYHLYRRWQGFYVQKGNPKNIKDFTDLTRNDVRMINRDKGSGIRVFVDEMCKKLDIDTRKIYGYNDEASSHFIAATAVARQSADVALGTEKFSRMVEGIDFIPLKQESYDIVFRENDLDKEEFRKLLYIIQSEEFRKEAEAVEGYDTEGLGERIL